MRVRSTPYLIPVFYLLLSSLALGALGREATLNPVTDLLVNVSGAPGANGEHGSGYYTSAGQAERGRDAGDAGPSTPGQDAGTIQVELTSQGYSPQSGTFVLRGTLDSPSQGTLNLQQEVNPEITRKIRFEAMGGQGGTGGDGGRGQNGGTGLPGANATQCSNGTSGGPGGDGGDGGEATSGSDGGRGGRVEIRVNRQDMHLLMVVHEPKVAGGQGGPAGRNGDGGRGGDGGPGGSSYSWTESYTTQEPQTWSDGQGNMQTTWVTQTHYTNHTNSGGPNGSPGRSGDHGKARVQAGRDGRDGTFQYIVDSSEGSTAYSGKYDLQLVSFEFQPGSRNGIFEPGETVFISKVTVRNNGQMPTPPFQGIQIFLKNAGWVVSDGSTIRIPRSLEPGEQVTLDDGLTFQVREHEGSARGTPFIDRGEVAPSAEVTVVQREFEGFHLPQTFEVRYPIEITPVSALNSLEPGKSTRVFWKIKNISGIDFGGESEIRRQLAVQLGRTNGDLNGSSLSFSFTASDGRPNSSAPTQLSQDFVTAVSTLKAGESLLMEGQLTLAPEATPSAEAHFKLGLKIGRIGAPDQLKEVEFQTFSLRAAQVFKKSPGAGILLLTNHKTRQDEIEAWRELAARLDTTVDVWDLSHYGHFDLMERFSEGNASFLEAFRGKTIVLLDHFFDAVLKEGVQKVQGSQFLSKPQVLKAIQEYGIRFYILGRNFPLGSEALIPSDFQNSRSLDLGEAGARGPWRTPFSELANGISVFKKRFFSKGSEGDLNAAAKQLSENLMKLHPDRRYLITRDLTENGTTPPKPTSRGARPTEMPIGVLRAIRSLDVNESGIFVLSASEAEMSAPDFIRGPTNARGLLAAIPFQTKLALLRQFLSGDETVNPAHGMLGFVKDAILTELAEEQKVLLESPWKAGLTRSAVGTKMQKLAQFSQSILLPAPLDFQKDAGNEALDLLAKATLMAQEESALWENFVPGRRAPGVERVAKQHLVRAFNQFFFIPEGDSQLWKANRAQAKRSLRSKQVEIREAWRTELTRENQGKRLSDRTKLKNFILDRMISATAAQGRLTSFANQLGSARERVLDEGFLDRLRKSDARTTSEREALEEKISAGRSHFSGQ